MSPSTPAGATWSRSRSVCCAANASNGASPPSSSSSLKSPLGNASATRQALASNGCSQPRKPAPKSAAPTPSHSSLPNPTPKSHNHCAAVLVRWSNLEPMRLYDALRGLHWTVLAFSGADSSTDAISDTHRWLSALIGQYGTDRLRALLIMGEPTGPDLPSQTGGLTISVDAWRVVHDKYDAL